MTTFEQVAERARMWLATGEAELKAGRLPVAFEACRTAAELAAKALLLRAQKPFPQSHMVAGELQQAGLMPAGVDGKRLHGLLSKFTLGTYGFDQPVHRAEAQEALRIARRMVSALAAAS